MFVVFVCPTAFGPSIQICDTKRQSVIYLNRFEFFIRSITDCKLRKTSLLSSYTYRKKFTITSAVKSILISHLNIKHLALDKHLCIYYNVYMNQFICQSTLRGLVSQNGLVHETVWTNACLKSRKRISVWQIQNFMIDKTTKRSMNVYYLMNKDRQVALLRIVSGEYAEVWQKHTLEENGACHFLLYYTR